MMDVYRDAYARQIEATVLSHEEDGCFTTSASLFYPRGGGQPGDRGRFIARDGEQFTIHDTFYDSERRHCLLKAEEGTSLPGVGVKGVLHLDWERRWLFMRVHTALHLLSVVLPYPVTGGAIGEGEGRLDFDIAEAGLAAKEEVSQKLNELIKRGASVRQRWISEEELDSKPEMVKTMKVKPPRGQGQVRLVEIEGLDLQPCGGTHVANTSEIGAVEVLKIEKKGAMNRRVKIGLCDS